MLRYWTAGESHGKTLIALVDGFPAGVTVDTEPINIELRRRQGGYGRGGRQRIENDAVEIRTGIWRGTTLGSPIVLEVPNRDYKLERLDDLARPRPGHGDLTGAVKFLGSIRGVLERASARETAARVAVGALARQLLATVGADIVSHVFAIGQVALPDPLAVTYEEARDIGADAQLHCVDAEVEREMMTAIDRARDAGDTMGGAFEVIALSLIHI